MNCVYVLMYSKDDRMIPYAVFENSIIAQKMKREGDEIVTVPFFRMDQLVITDKALEGVDLEKLSPSDTPWKITYQSAPRSKDSTLAPPDYEPFPRVTCNKTVDEHSWTNRSD